MITISRVKIGLFKIVLERTRKIHKPDESLVVTILYTILKYILEKDKLIILELEKELVALENIPPTRRSTGFLENTFYLRKEANQLVPSLLHLKEIISMITLRRFRWRGSPINTP